MKRHIATWLAELAGLGRAFVDVLKAEWSTLTTDIGSSGRLFLRAILLLAVAAGLLGWATILLSLALIAFLDRFMEQWQAAAIVATGILLIAAVLLLLAKSILGRVQPPGELIQTRVQDHLDWIHAQLDDSGSPEPREDAANDAD